VPRFTAVATKDELIYEVYADRIRSSEELPGEAAAEPDAWKGFVRFFEQSISILANDRGLRISLGAHAVARWPAYRPTAWPGCCAKNHKRWDT